jgi:mono/diheme cytochrome c family protein
MKEPGMRVFVLVVTLGNLVASLAYADGTSNLGPAYPDEAPAAAKPEHSLPPPSKVIGKSPTDVAASAPKGTLRNPYTGQVDKIKEGHELYFSYSCNGCHGGDGGGGMCPPLTRVVWIYGSDDDTLFRLITLGSQDLQHDGYTRHNVVHVVGPMPPFGELIESDDQLWKILAFVRSVYADDPKEKNW